MHDAGSSTRASRPVEHEEDATVGEVYLPIFVLGTLGLLFALFSVLLAPKTVGAQRYNRALTDSYECGIDPTPQPIGGGRFPVKYYITAMMFLVFDVEVAFLYPWAVTFDALGVFGFAAMMIFLIVLGVAYFYEIRRGGLEWD